MEAEIIFEPTSGDIFGLDKYQIYREFALNHCMRIIELEPIVEHIIDMPDNIIRRYQLVREASPSYIELRQQNYPSISDQLDMIYWDKVNNTQIWQDTISQIKKRYPKPTNGEQV